MRSLFKFLFHMRARVLYFLPRKFVRRLGWPLGFLWYDVLRFRKGIILKNLQLAFPEWSEEQRKKVGRESVYQMAENFSEFFIMPAIDQKWMKKNVEFRGWEYVEQALLQKKGILLLGQHIGHGDLAANCIELNGAHMSIITKRFKNKLFDDLWFSIRGAQGVGYLDAHSPRNAFEILKALGRNEMIAFVLDQFMGKPYGIATEFFGVRTGTAYGLAVFAMKSKAPVIPICTYEGKDNKFIIEFAPPLDIQTGLPDNKESAIVEITQRFNNWIEAKVRLHPEQWMWVHRRWKNFD